MTNCSTYILPFITFMRRIYLIDCPGVVYPTGDSDTDIVLKGVVSVRVWGGGVCVCVCVYLCVFMYGMSHKKVPVIKKLSCN